jgi:hypothetical protein
MAAYTAEGKKEWSLSSTPLYAFIFDVVQYWELKRMWKE